MKTIRFTAYPDGYKCDHPGDQSGEYVSATPELIAAHQQAQAIFTVYQRGGIGGCNADHLVPALGNLLAALEGRLR